MGILDNLKNVLGGKKQGNTTAAAPTSARPDGADGADKIIRSYTVESGDTLWKIADSLYGDGTKYLEIFEANKSLLTDPDHIIPGQELTIPPLDS